ncbi:SPOR domain-containing protein [Rhodobacter sp. SGA-6-6]|uniref:SPOR domain-containing protein n=1 Tax=Rhodobacter sp. SGA-6-6 TaxID=2710882 RepID=UPI0013EA5B85|nr:SPOR domain-containing protein [Rhodobacter sp. SGA-6-6]NGM47233.1 SPOR domain-containing protein [Rhodobacter sp. SGA-6-6]
MADRDFAEYGVPAAHGPGRAQRLVQMAGAASSVALVVALGLWGYKLAVRDIAGVPVIRALEGPARVAPEDPGGAIADHQGLAVNDVVAEGAAAPPAERLVLAPKPVELTLEDGPGLADGLPPEEAEVQPASMADPAAMVPPAAGESDDAVAAALAEALGIEPEAVETGVETAALDAEGLPAPEGAVTRSPRPMPRPDRAAAPEAAVAVAPPVEVDPATLAPGTRLVQFGTFDSDKEARAEWTRLAGRFGVLMEGKSMVIQSAVSGGSTFYRLRALGFEGEDDARRFCSALLIENASCIPVAHK